MAVPLPCPLRAYLGPYLIEGGKSGMVRKARQKLTQTFDRIIDKLADLTLEFLACDELLCQWRETVGLGLMI
jgi:hypothetical protein